MLGVANNRTESPDHVKEARSRYFSSFFILFTPYTNFLLFPANFLGCIFYFSSL